VWSITEKGKSFKSADEVIAAVKQWRTEYNRLYVQKKKKKPDSELSFDAKGDGLEPEGSNDLDEEIEATIEPDWRDQLLDRLVVLSPAGFERLSQRLLREAGFRDVEVLGKSNDGGIDGVGVLRID
jgi:restriction system protein